VYGVSYQNGHRGREIAKDTFYWIRQASVSAQGGKVNLEGQERLTGGQKKSGEAKRRHEKPFRLCAHPLGEHLEQHSASFRSEQARGVPAPSLACIVDNWLRAKRKGQPLRCIGLPRAIGGEVR